MAAVAPQPNIGILRFPQDDGHVKDEGHVKDDGHLNAGVDITERETGSVQMAVPVRGTQSFVGVMAEVFRRPSLTGLEALWRWVFWCAVLAGPVSRLYPLIAPRVLRVQATGIGSAMYGFSPLDMMQAAGPQVWLYLAGCVVLWVFASAAGKKRVFRRIDRELRPRFASLAALGILRWFSWALALGLWLILCVCAGNGLVATPTMRGAEPQWVLFCAVMIVGTLLLFVGWLGTSWIFGLASVYAARFGMTAMAGVGAAWRSGVVRSKVAEINLVMGIVKIALLVLALVFSACPLPFETVETQNFLLCWTAGVLLLYFLASDYFHVVRLVAFLRMTEVFAPLPTGPAAHAAEAAS